MSRRAPLDVAVIGAGMAGLSCAVALQQAGLRVTVFDKSCGPAGRMSTRRGEGWECDHGAQYFTARDPEFRAEVARWEAMGAAASWNPRLRVYGGTREAARAADVARWVGMPRMTAPAALLAKTLALARGVTVVGLEREHERGLERGHDGERWRLLLDKADGDSFDAVVLALPAPQAAPLLAALAPGLSALADSAVMQACWTVMLQFDAPLSLPLDAAFINGGPLRWIARNNSKPGRAGFDTWVLHASAEWSGEHLEDDAARVAQTMIAAFCDLGGAQPQGFAVHRWRHAMARPALDVACAWDAQQHLGLCGDWLNHGTVEGAWLSGRALARAMTA